MTWFRVDDKLHSHKKRMRAGMAAMGLWATAGSWCSDQLTDGFIPDYVCATFDPDWELLAERLVKAGFWEPAEQDGDKGWQFHQWLEQQPSREQVLAQRTATAKRQQDFRERAKQKRNTGRNGVTNGVSHGGGNSVSNGLPDPTPLKGEGKGLAEPDPHLDPVGYMQWQREQQRRLRE